MSVADKSTSTAGERDSEGGKSERDLLNVGPFCVNILFYFAFRGVLPYAVTEIIFLFFFFHLFIYLFWKHMVAVYM